MTQFNIFSIGNHISDGTGTVNNKNNTRGDTKWKKVIHHHPDNLYRSYADEIAMRLDANIYYLGKPESTFKQILNVFKNSYPSIMKNFPDDINLYFLNLGYNQNNWDKFTKQNEPIEDPVEKRHQQVIFFKELFDDTESFSKFVKNINHMGLGYNNRLIILTPNFENLSEISNSSILRATNITDQAFKENSTNREDGHVLNKDVWPWVHAVNADMRKLLLDPYALDSKLTIEDQKKLGENLFLRLTEQTDMFII